MRELHSDARVTVLLDPDTRVICAALEACKDGERPVLLLDEPMNGLDLASVRVVEAIVRKLSDGAQVSLEQDGQAGQVSLRSGRSRFISRCRRSRPWCTRRRRRAPGRTRWCCRWAVAA